MPNTFAYISLISWPLVTFLLINSQGFKKGTFLSIILSYILLPTSFSINLPGIPAFDKASITTIAIIAYMLLANKKFGISSYDKTTKLFLILLILSPVFTSLTNREYYLSIPGISLYDSASLIANTMLNFFPFILAASYFKRYDDQVFILKLTTIIILLYSILIAYEIRMSPQLHTIIYGYFPHDWFQQVRSGGFRAVVFLGHGLLIATLLSVALLSATTLNKAKVKILGINSLYLIIYLAIILVFSKSYAALILGLAGLVIIKYISPKKIHIIAVSLCIIFLTYPILSSSDLFPHDRIVDQFNDINTDRAQSLSFRFHHEKELLIHSNQKIIFGWGSWGRNRVYDPETHEDISVTDGLWIITLSSFGWFGFLSRFFFIIYPIYIAFSLRNSNIINKNEHILLAGHSLLLSIILIDQLPNSSLNHFYWFIAGALYGRVRHIHKNINNLKAPSDA